MNRSLPLRLLKTPSYIQPIRPIPSSLPTNLRSISTAPRQSVPSALLWARGLRTTAIGLEEKKDKNPGSKGPDPGPNPATSSPHREDQNKTSSARSELRTATKDFAQIISGGSPDAAAAGAREQSSHSHGGNVKDDFVDITRSMFTNVPKPVLTVGLAGTIPYLGTSLATIILAREASYASVGTAPSGYSLEEILSALHHVEHIQITYGAIILSFLGALHWGMEFAKLGGEQGYKRLMLGIVPVLFAWPTTFLTHGVALATQWVGFTGAWFLDQRASQLGWTTSWYSTYRFYLSVIVGFSIIGTLAGTGYYGAGAGANVDPSSPRSQHTTERQSGLKRLDRVKEKNFPPGAEKKTGKITGSTTGDIEVKEDNEAFLKFTNVEKEKEKKEQEEEEQKKKAEEQDEKDKKQKEESKDMKDSNKDRKEDVKDKAGKGEKKDDSEAKDEAKENKGDDKKDEKSKDDGMKGEEKEKKSDDKKKEDKSDDKKKEDKGEENKPKEEKKDDNKEQSQDGGKGKNDSKQQKAEEEKGAAGDKNTGMK